MLVIKPGTLATDTASGIDGMITHLHVEQDGRAQYCLQPKGLNPEDGQPLRRIWTIGERLNGATPNHTASLPLEVLGTEVTDEASGFSGTATALQLHISGCLHVVVQPKGRHPKNNGMIECCDFDIRRLSGKAIKKLTEAEREADQAQRPSPSGSIGMPHR